MTKPNPAQDPLQETLDEVWRVHQLLAAKVPPGQGEGGGRRPQPASRPPLQVDPVSLMAELEQYLGWWISQARWNLHPTRRIDITDRVGAVCPYCAGKLVGWMRTPSDDPNDPRVLPPDEVVCLTPTEHQPTEPAHWTKADWPWLGRMTGVREDARYGPRLQSAGET